MTKKEKQMCESNEIFLLLFSLSKIVVFVVVTFVKLYSLLKI